MAASPWVFLSLAMVSPPLARGAGNGAPVEGGGGGGRVGEMLQGEGKGEGGCLAMEMLMLLLCPGVQLACVCDVVVVFAWGIFLVPVLWRCSDVQLVCVCL